VATTTTVAADPVGTTPRSKFSKPLRIRKSGVYRARVAPGDGDHIAGSSAKRSAVGGRALAASALHTRVSST
jgi:hypothetical protein